EYLSSTPNTEEQKANLEKSYDEVKTSVDRKEKNQLDHVKKLFELGYFADADQSLKGLEKEEVDELGVASAAVYYYKILSEHKTSSDDELIKMISGTGSDLKNDKNYILSRISGGGIYKTKIDRIEKAIEDINDARERSLQKKKRADEKERLRFLSIAERQKEKELQKQRRKQEREEKRNKMFAKSNNPYLTKSIVTFYSVFGGIALLGVILGLTVAGPAGASVLITDGCVMFVWFITSICLKNCRFAQALKTMPDGRAWIFITSILVLSIAFIVGGILFTPQFEREDESGFTYSVSARYCFVTGYNGTADTLEIPSKYKGKTVTKIQHDAFMDNTDLISVTIPDTVRVIKYNAFRNCTSLENVTMSGNVRKVKDYVFCQCESLTAIDLTGVKRIGAYAFDSSAVNDVVLSNSLKHIRIYAFNNCTSLEEITIPASVKRIWHDAFGGCVNLKSAIFEDPKGWKSTINDPISSDKLSNPATAASLLVDSDWKWRH
ncbi:MAG: leucine-rich repeat protein, partial [Bacteroidales bacterium]|nr:leucine-rich repeat protein [Bacteroidales bacterium]